jgi:hypothetical protein
MAKNYINNLSEEVKKGQLEKARRGCYLGEVRVHGHRRNQEGTLYLLPFAQSGKACDELFYREEEFASQLDAIVQRITINSLMRRSG